VAQTDKIEKEEFDVNSPAHMQSPKFFYWLVSLLVPPALVLGAVTFVSVIFFGTGNALGSVTLFWSLFNGPVTIAVGLLIWWRVRGNVVGPLLILWGVQNILWATPLDVLKPVNAIYVLSIGLLSLIYLLIYFPNGKPYPARASSVYTLLFVVWALNGVLYVLSHPTFQTVAVRLLQPHWLHVPALSGFQPVTEVIYLASLALWIWGPLTLVLRYRGATTKEKTQIKWVAFLALALIPLAAVALAGNSIYRNETPRWYEVFQAVAYTFAQLAPTLIIGISILRYRLWDIDILIRRTVTYTILAALLAIVYFVSVILLQRIFAGIIGDNSEIITVLSTLAIAALFVPLRNRIQDALDKRFNRKKYDAQKILQKFGETVRDETDLEKLTSELVNVVQETMQPKRVSVWLKKEEK
jgi:hypothetical protein